jgi:hypothetical protein
MVMTGCATSLDIRGAETAQAIEWVQTIYGIPGDKNPLFDPTGAFARLGDVGDTLHLAGSFDDDVRSFDVDFGDTLVVPLVNTVSDEFTNTLPDLRQDVLTFTQEIELTDIFLRVDVGNDGHVEFDEKFDISEVRYFPKVEFPEEAAAAREFFIEPGPEDEFVFEAPDNAVIGEPFPAEGATSKGYTSGYYAQIDGLPKGEHEIAFGGTAFGGDTEISVTAVITVGHGGHRDRDGDHHGGGADPDPDPDQGARPYDDVCPIVDACDLFG